jgi:hypothetical protein
MSALCKYLPDTAAVDARVAMNQMVFVKVFPLPHVVTPRASWKAATGSQMACAMYMRFFQSAPIVRHYVFCFLFPPLCCTF